MSSFPLFAPLDAAADAARHAVTAFADAVHPVLGVSATAAAVVLFTVAVRLALHPLARAAYRGERARTRLAPELRRIAERHGGDRAAQLAAQQRLYAREGVTPFTGCLPMLLPLPLFSVMYRLFSLPRLRGHANSLLAQPLFGTPLGAHLAAASAHPAQLAVFLVLFALIGAVSYVTYRRARAHGQPLPYLAFGTVLFAALLPLAGVLYLLTTTSFTAAERALLHGRRARPDGVVSPR